MEGRVYVCTWKKTDAGYRVWVKRRPKLAAEGETFEAADERLWEVILRATGDGENNREYVPALPTDGADTAGPRIVSVSGDTIAAMPDPLGMLYTGERCPRCGNSTGGRSEVPLRLDIESGYEGGIAFIREGTFAKGTRPFFSDAFLDLLTADERERFIWRRVDRPARAKKVFYELVGSTVDLPVVAVTHLPGDGGGRCEVCGWLALPLYNQGSAGPRRFVCSADLPATAPSCFTASEGRSSYLCFTLIRWESLVGKAGTRGLVSSDVGVARPDQCLRSPEVPTLAEIERRIAKATGG
jgi:hypothetical protein